MDRMDNKKLPASIVTKMKSTIYKEIDFVEYVSKRTTIDGNTTMANINVVCEFHDTDTATAARLSKRRIEKDNTEFWTYFCNNPACIIHQKHETKGINLITYHQEVLMKETGMFVSYEDAVVDLYTNVLGYEMPEFTEETVEKTPEEKAAEEEAYLLNLLNLYIVKIAEKQLAENPEAMEFISKKRGLPNYLISAFHIGYIPSGFKLSEVLEAKGFPKELLIKAGITSAKSGKDTLFDRVIIPMWNEKINPMDVNFSFKDALIPNLYTRTVHIRNDRDKCYKHRYLNRELPLFNIQSCLGKKNIVLVEGIVDSLSILDVITKMRVEESKMEEPNFMYKPSETGVIATYGTNGLSDEAMKKYLGSFENIILAADNDVNSAGQTANIKRAKKLKSMFPKANIKIVTWREKDANDMLVAGYKPQDFWACIESSICPEYFAINTVLQPLEREKDKILSAFNMLDTITPMLKSLVSEIPNITENNPMELYKFTEILSKKIGIPVEIILLTILGTKKDTLSLISSLTDN